MATRCPLHHDADCEGHEANFEEFDVGATDEQLKLADEAEQRHCSSWERSCGDHGSSYVDLKGCPLPPTAQPVKTNDRKFDER